MEWDVGRRDARREERWVGRDVVEKKGRSVGDEALLKEAFHFHLFGSAGDRAWIKVFPPVPRHWVTLKSRDTDIVNEVCC